MKSAEGEAPPPKELQLAFWCDEWGTLPDGGGLYDQEYLLMYHMTALRNIYRMVARVRNMVGEQIHQLTPGERRIGEYLRREGLL